MNWYEKALGALGKQRESSVAAPITYALIALADQIRTTGGAITERLESIDDALRNTVGGRS